MNDDPSHNPDAPEPSAPTGDPESSRPTGNPEPSPPTGNPEPSPPTGNPESSRPTGNPVPPPGQQPPPPAGYGQQFPAPYGHGARTPPPDGYGQQPPPPYGYGQPPLPPYGYGAQTPPYGYGPQTPPYGYFDPANPWDPYHPGTVDPLVSPDFTGWWNRSFRLLKAAWRPLVAVQLCSVLPIAAITVVTALTIGRTAQRVVPTYDSPQVDLHTLLAPLLAPFLAALPGLLAAFVLNLIVPLAMIHILVRTATGRPAPVGGALLAGLRRILPMLGWNILASLLIAVGLLFCVLPGIYVAAALAILRVIVLLEPGRGIGRSFQLFHANVGVALGRLVTMFGLSLGASLAVITASSVIRAGLSSGPTAIALVLTALLSGVVSLLSGVVLAPMYLTTYADLRARQEPFSTAVLATV